MKRVRIVCLILIIIIFSSLAAACNSPTVGVAMPTCYDIVAQYDETSRTLSCFQQVSYVNSTDCELSYLEFNLPANGFRQSAVQSAIPHERKTAAYYNGDSWGGIDFSSVSVEGTEIETTISGEDSNSLVVNLPSVLHRGETINVTMEYAVTIPEVVARTGVTSTTVNLGNFYPTAAVFENGEFRTNPYYSWGDPFFAETADFYITLKLDESFTAAFSGNVEEEYCQDGMRVYEVSAQEMRDVAVVLSKQFEIVSDRVNGIDVEYYYTADKTPKTTLKTAVDAISTFSSCYGDYAWDSFTVVETPLLSGGMEYCGLVFISASLDEAERERVVIHETAHQWWYCGVGSDQLNHAWLDEGLAEFSVALFYAETDATEKYQKLSDEIYSAYGAYRQALSEIESRSTAMSRPLSQFVSEADYVLSSYLQGFLLFQSLYQIVGEQDFKKALSQYYSDYLHKVASPDCLIDCFERACKISTAPIFEAFTRSYIVF